MSTSLWLLLKRTGLVFLFGFGLVQLANAHDFSSVITTAKPAVVSIDTKRSWIGGLLTKDQSDNSNSKGTGFLISSKGLVATAAHVVNAAKSVEVELRSGQTYKAEVIKIMPVHDLALIQITNLSPLKNLPYIKLAQSQPLEGEEVLAMGSPFKFPLASTSGLVSAINVKTKGSAGPGVILTDAAVNPGMSGGPLLNTKSEAVAVLSQIYSTTGSFAGVTFATPVQYLQAEVDQSTSP